MNRPTVKRPRPTIISKRIYVHNLDKKEIKIISDEWFKVTYNRSIVVDPLSRWIDENCTGKYMFWIASWYFENEEDVVAFKLKFVE